MRHAGRGWGWALAVVFGMAVGTADAGAYDADALDSAFDRYFFPEKHGLVVDLDMQAGFAGEGNAVIHRKGAAGQGRILLADPVQGSLQQVVDEAALRAALTAAGAPGARPGIVRYQSARRQLIVSVGESGQWAYDVASGRASRHDQRPKDPVSPDGRYRLFVRDYDLWIADVRSGEETALTRDGDFDRRYGINYPRFGQQVEANSDHPPMRVEAWWSPDSSRVLSYRLDRNGTPFHEGVQTQPPEGGEARRFRYVYPNAGDPDVPRLHPLLIDVASRRVRLLDVPVHPLVFPVPPKLSWEGDRIFYQWASRGFGELKLFEIEPETGKVRLRVHEALAPNVTVTSTAIRPVPELGGSLLVSERSGWAQLYWLADGDDPTGGRRLTSGDWEITALVHASKDGILVTGKGREPGENPYFEHLYRVDLDGGLVRLTPEPLDHKVEVSKDGRWFVDRMSSPTEPTRTLVRSAVDGRIAMELGRADPWNLLADGFTSPEIFQGLATDGKTVLYGTIYRPRHFDPARRYPVIEHVYTGPTRHRFRENYEANVGGMASALTQLGTIVVTIDAPGTVARGRAFRMQAWQNLHAVGVDEHVHMLRAMQARYPYMDLDRGVGVIGGSSGGYDTFRFLVRRPDVYKAGVSQSGNHQLRMVKAWWPEIHMGRADESVWQRNSNATYADRLQGKLLLVHGDIDDNVPIGTTLTLSQALTRAGKDHRLLVLPNVGHAVRTPEFHRAVRAFFMAELIRPGESEGP